MVAKTIPNKVIALITLKEKNINFCVQVLTDFVQVQNKLFKPGNLVSRFSIKYAERYLHFDKFYVLQFVPVKPAFVQVPY